MATDAALEVSLRVSEGGESTCLARGERSLGSSRTLPPLLCRTGESAGWIGEAARGLPRRLGWGDGSLCNSWSRALERPLRSGGGIFSSVTNLLTYEISNQY